MKKCTSCKNEKQLHEFSKCKSYHDGLSIRCKACDKITNSKRPKVISDYYQKNKEKIKAYQASEKSLLRRAKYRAANAEKIKQYDTLRRASNPNLGRKDRAARRARELNAKGSFSAGDIQKLMLLQKQKCICCKASIEKKYHIDHIYPLVRGGSNDPTNLQLLCPKCNLSKNAKDPVVFMQQRGFLL